MTNLRHGISVSYGHRVVFQRLIVNRYAPGSANLVLTAIPFAHVADRVPGHCQVGFEGGVNGSGTCHDVRFIRDEWEYSYLDGRQNRLQTKYRSAIGRLRAGLLFVVSVQ